jgi:tRNA(Ile2) C34 agmatinyltransferase TiaS
LDEAGVDEVGEGAEAVQQIADLRARVEALETGSGERGR